MCSNKPALAPRQCAVQHRVQTTQQHPQGTAARFNSGGVPNPLHLDVSLYS